MGKVTIQEYTTKHPITMIGTEAGVCWGANTTDQDANFRRGISCLESGHGRTFEFPDVYLMFEGYSARVIREWYTHIGGLPTRLQESTRYVDYKTRFGYITPKSIATRPIALHAYRDTMEKILETMKTLDFLGVPKEDIAMCLPFAMETTAVVKHNFRSLIDMSHQRMCSRAYHEYRQLFRDVSEALRVYSDEWAYLVDNYFMPKCKYMGFCKEKHSCGLMPRKEVTE